MLVDLCVPVLVLFLSVQLCVRVCVGLCWFFVSLCAVVVVIDLLFHVDRDYIQ